MSNNKASPKDVFLHILSMGALYFSAGAFLSLVFTLINVGFPDPANPVYDPGSSLRWSISLLVVLFPVYLWSVKKLHSIMKKDPKSRDYRIRKWLINFTLFAAGALILGDVVSLIYTFLSGELTIRFLLKVVTILLVAGAIFGYYRYELNEGVEKISKYSNKIGWATGVIVLAAVVAGFFIAGSPFRQRLVKLDNQRINHLSRIQSEVLNYWRDKDSLPSSLEDIEDDFSRFKAPTKDPATGEPYEYRTTGELSFELCATFGTASKNDEQPIVAPSPVKENYKWDHPKGKKCFTRSIDPERYQNSPPER